MKSSSRARRSPFVVAVKSSETYCATERSTTLLHDGSHEAPAEAVRWIYRRPNNPYCGKPEADDVQHFS